MSLVHDDSTNFYQTDHVGPDELCMADSLYSDSLSKAVLLRSKSVDQAKFPSMSIYTMLKQTVDARQNQNAIAYKSNEIWYYFTYLEYWKMCMKAAKSFIKVCRRLLIILLFLYILSNFTTFKKKFKINNFLEIL